jgi:hypothetical protein
MELYSIVPLYVFMSLPYISTIHVYIYVRREKLTSLPYKLLHGILTVHITSINQGRCIRN